MFHSIQCLTNRLGQITTVLKNSYASSGSRSCMDEDIYRWLLYGTMLRLHNSTLLPAPVRRHSVTYH
ncbi:hypothetical protein BD310DRAFT_920603 [Dichomitus squalens]|uniref:Uncharacterized protein n=1 Tax=Dichomitus squalens TaxID=114155 RepID=A0A4Q9Q382_9APHY|nr:hypothetical protein BD310DRAFT_920603 [Dichomitus squalens]